MFILLRISWKNSRFLSVQPREGIFSSKNWRKYTTKHTFHFSVNTAIQTGLKCTETDCTVKMR